MARGRSWRSRRCARGASSLKCASAFWAPTACFSHPVVQYGLHCSVFVDLFPIFASRITALDLKAPSRRSLEHLTQSYALAESLLHASTQGSCIQVQVEILLMFLSDNSGIGWTQALSLLDPAISLLSQLRANHTSLPPRPVLQLTGALLSFVASCVRRGRESLKAALTGISPAILSTAPRRAPTRPSRTRNSPSSTSSRLPPPP